MTLPPPAEAALLLDIDGTLIDLAPTPDAVVVPAGLPEVLLRLREALGDALAMVTGRTMAQVDALFPGVPYAAAAEHGGATRRRPGGAVERPTLPDLPPGWLDAAAAVVADHSGCLVETKAHGFVLHYRRAPDAGAPLRTAAEALVASDPRFQLLEASMAWEVRPGGVDKGMAVQLLCEAAPFAGRRPIFIGDDRTDEDGIRAAIALGGAGLLVGPTFGNPAGVRDWLSRSADRVAAGDDWAPLR